MWKEAEREWLRERCGKIVLRVSIDRRRRWASFHRNPFVKKKTRKKKREGAKRSSSPCHCCQSLPLSLRVEVSLVSSRSSDLN